MPQQQAILAGGCFWCLEAVYDDLVGVNEVVPGYIDGETDNPTYEQICTGTTGHAEAVRVTFDDSVVSYADLLDIFFHIHDPTTLNRQGNDVGTQYRSAIFTLTDEQMQQARAAVDAAAALWPDPIVTQIASAPTFWPAEDYHLDYFARTGDRNPYCTYVVAPKLQKFRKSFAQRSKASSSS